MALGPISQSPIQPPQSAPARDVGAARQAFFQAALGKVQAPADPAPAAPAPAQPEPKAEAADSSRGYRPGRLLDIKV